MAERISRALLPDNTSIADDGMAMFGGVRADDLARKFGTPLFVYDEEHIRRRCREAVKAFPDGVSYASKAFLCKAIAKLVSEEGMGLDVATIGEAYVALQSGVPPADFICAEGGRVSPPPGPGGSPPPGEDKSPELSTEETLTALPPPIPNACCLSLILFPSSSI